MGIIQGFGYIPAFNLYDITLEYFQAVFTDSAIWISALLSSYVAIVSASVSTILAVFLAFALISLKRTKGALYNLIKMPMFIPWSVTGFLMLYFFSNKGWLARVFFALNLSKAAVLFENILFMPHQMGIIIAFVWACVPFECFFIMNTMENISNTLGEVGQNLGAGTWQTFRFITLPLCFNAIKDAFIIVLFSCFGNYEIPLLLGMTKPRLLSVEAYYQYEHFDLQHRPYAMAVNALMLILSLILIFILHGFFSKKYKKERK